MFELLPFLVLGQFPTCYPFLFSPSSLCWWPLRSWWWSASSSSPTLSAASGSPSPSCPSRWAAWWWWWWWFICWWWWRWLFWSPFCLISQLLVIPLREWRTEKVREDIWSYTHAKAHEKKWQLTFSAQMHPNISCVTRIPRLFLHHFDPGQLERHLAKQGRCTLCLIHVVCHYDSRDQDDSYRFDTFTRRITGCLHP